MRLTIKAMIAAGAMLVGQGIYSAARVAVADDTVDQMNHATWAIAGFVVGGAVLVAARRAHHALPERSPLATPIAGFGRITHVRDTGITVNGTTSVLDATIEVLAPGVETFQTNVPLRLERSATAALQPGTPVPVLVDRADHTKVTVDPGEVSRWLARTP